MMPVTKIDRTLNKLVVRLNDSQNSELIRLARGMLGVKLVDTRQTIEEYNLEIDRAIQNVKQGNFKTLKEIKKEMKSW